MNSISYSSDGSFAFWGEMGKALSSALGVLFGGFLGGTIGAAQGIDTKYQMDELDSEGKRKLLSRLFPKVE
ncbi:MAG: hypothetical protein L0Y80_05550 [Ignavibacteriae bacterium]|nr:hypothetical protein [Ignavibacteriota bacterium]